MAILNPDPNSSTFLDDLGKDVERREQLREIEERTKLENIEGEVDPRYINEPSDPRDKEGGGGVQGLAAELGSVISGGIQDTASSFATFPERAVDMVSGEMQREREEKGYYRPEWSPFTDYENPIITKTWWGKLLRGVVHFGSTAGIITAGAAAAGISAPASIVGLAGYSLLRAAAIGAATDLISKESDGHNALAMLRDQYGFMDTPLSTRDTDHPMWMKFKNIVEGMGIGLVFDGATILLGKGSTAAKSQIKARGDSVEFQTLRKGLQELRKNEFGASKNKPIAGPHQGAHTSEVPYETARQQLKKTREDWAAEDGSTGSVTTPVQRERIGAEGQMTEELVETVLRGLYSDDKFKAEMAAVKAGQQSMMDVFGDAVAAHQRTLLGRNAAEMSAAEFLEEFYKSSVKYDITDLAGNVVDTKETWTTKNIVAGDLIVGSLLKQLRDQGIAGRELKDYVNLLDTDGPTKQVFDTMMTAMTEIKRARAYSSDSFRQIGAGKRAQAIEEAVTSDMADTRDAILSILQIAKDEPNDDLLNAAFELFSSMKTVNNLDDFDTWARKMIKGGRIDPKGPDRTGALIRELEGMMVHSVLSGPKTPMRAIMGTATATFLRPMAQFIGSTMALPFTGDTQTVRASLASMNAMMQAIPESFDLFRTKLDSYWSGDVSSVKTRFAEFTRNDSNWELLRRWAEDSGRATDGERAMFAMANQARNWNNNSWLTYSTKIMAATDDAFGYILGRAKMREKAMLSAMDAQSKGLVPEITPELMALFEEDFYRQIFDADGNIIDEATKYAKREVTLTTELQGFSKGLNDVFTANPWAKPFFLFARTGINGLTLTAKHTPGVNFLVKEFNDIAFANPKNLEGLQKYGITTERELINAQALQNGRLAMGGSFVSMAAWSYLSGNMTGSGPVDASTRKVWEDGGFKANNMAVWLPNGEKIWIDYSDIEPFSTCWQTICDIGDASQLMGPEWTEKKLQTMALILGQTVTSKSYLSGMKLWVDAFRGSPGAWSRVAAVPTQVVPLSSLRNSIGKVITPYTRELSSDVFDSIRNRNLATEAIASDPLDIRYNIMDGKPMKNWRLLDRVAYEMNPLGVSMDYSKGQSLLFKSGYDLRTSMFRAPDGTDLSNSPEARSLYQQAFGQEKLGEYLNLLADDPKIIASLEMMDRDRRSGLREVMTPRDYYHNRMIKKEIDRISRKAWKKVRSHAVIAKLRQDQYTDKVTRQFKQFQTATLPTEMTNKSIEEIISIYR